MTPPRRYAESLADNAAFVGGVSRDRGAARVDESRPDQGSASVELVLATPLLGLLLMLVVQFAVWAHAVHIAQAAANDGVQAARAYQAGADRGRQATTTLLDHLAGSILTEPHVSCQRGPTTATVTVTGTAIAVVPGLHLPVEATVSAPLELARTTP
jgi:Flp pilus assembly protein TadG